MEIHNALRVVLVEVLKRLEAHHSHNAKVIGIFMPKCCLPLFSNVLAPLSQELIYLMSVVINFQYFFLHTFYWFQFPDSFLKPSTTVKTKLYIYFDETYTRIYCLFDIIENFSHFHLNLSQEPLHTLHKTCQQTKCKWNSSFIQMKDHSSFQVEMIILW